MPETEGTNGLNLWVTDDGPGIPAEHHDRIFDPFFTPRENGTGLGLTIVRKFVENHRGGIRIESSPPGQKQGCRFSIFLFEAISSETMLSKAIWKNGR